MIGATARRHVARRDASIVGPAAERSSTRRTCWTTPVAPSPVAGTGPHASFALRLSDDNDRHPAGVPVKVTGPVTRTVMSDADGYVKATVPPGFYQLQRRRGMPRGGDRPQGRQRPGRRRRRPDDHRHAAPALATSLRAGATRLQRPRRRLADRTAVDFTFTVEDHCEQTPAPGKGIPTYRVRDVREHADHQAAVPARRRADGRSHVTVACTAAGDVSPRRLRQAEPRGHDRPDRSSRSGTTASRAAVTDSA